MLTRINIKERMILMQDVATRQAEQEPQERSLQESLQEARDWSNWVLWLNVVRNPDPIWWSCPNLRNGGCEKGLPTALLRLRRCGCNKTEFGNESPIVLYAALDLLEVHKPPWNNQLFKQTSLQTTRFGNMVWLLKYLHPSIPYFCLIHQNISNCYLS